jgi:hypothetical protein
LPLIRNPQLEIIWLLGLNLNKPYKSIITNQYEEFNELEIPRYAILSHTWENEEISYAEASVIFLSYKVSILVPKAGFKKIKGFAAAARRARVDYVWIDICT